MPALPAFLHHITPQGRLPQGLPGVQHPWVANLREKALARFLEKGLPQPSLEEWRYTSLSGIEKTPFAPQGDAEAPAPTLPQLVPEAAARLVFVDGRFRPELSLRPETAGLRVSTLRQKLEANDAALRYAFPDTAGTDSWQDMNLALCEDGAVIDVDEGARSDAPVEIVYYATAGEAPRMRHMRPIVHVSAGADVQLVDIYAGEGRLFLSAVSQVLVEEHARLRRISANIMGRDGQLLLHENISVRRHGHYAHTLLHAGAKLVRHKQVACLEDTGAEAIINAALLAGTGRHIDMLTTLRHMAPHTRSQQNIRALAAEHAKTIFQGGVFVAPQAQKTSAQQTAHGLLLAPDAEINAKPALEIYADDVSCSHGATCGALDANALFYLRSRGIPHKEAERMLVDAFLADLFETVPEALQGPLTGWAERGLS